MITSLVFTGVLSVDDGDGFVTVTGKGVGFTRFTGIGVGLDKWTFVGNADVLATGSGGYGFVISVVPLTVYVFSVAVRN
jgi:hypothetical protein